MKVVSKTSLFDFSTIWFFNVPWIGNINPETPINVKKIAFNQSQKKWMPSGQAMVWSFAALVESQIGVIPGPPITDAMIKKPIIPPVK